MSIPYTVSVQVVLKKDQKRTESKKNPLIGGKGPNGNPINKATFDGETLSIISTIFKDKASGKFSEKSASLVIKVAKGEKSRSVGMININLADYIQIGDQVANVEKQKMPIEKCPDKDSYMEISVKSTLINMATGSDNISEMSGFDNMSCDSGLESVANFNNIDLDSKPKVVQEEQKGSEPLKDANLDQMESSNLP